MVCEVFHLKSNTLNLVLKLRFNLGDFVRATGFKLDFIQVVDNSICGYGLGLGMGLGVHKKKVIGYLYHLDHHLTRSIFRYTTHNCMFGSIEKNLLESGTTVISITQGVF